MSCLDDDLNDSDLFCKSIIQKRKASGSNNPKSSKQLKLTFPTKAPEDSSKESSTCNGEGTSVSAYFKSTKTTHTCPLCLRSFRTDSAYSTHMKQCAKSHKMTTQQLLGALELQKKQMQERRSLGLCSQKMSPPKKPAQRKRDDRERDSYDLALGIAISKSLSSSEAKAEASAGTQSTLNQFGIKSNPPTGSGRRKNDKKSALKERTAEDRQRIIIEKVAVVLLDEEGSEPEKRKSSANLALDDRFAGAVNVVPELWNLGENDEKRNWYVPEIKTLLVPTEGREEKEPEPVLEENLESEIAKLSLPREGIHKDWKRLVNNSKFSDVRGRTKDCQDFHLHSVVVFARRAEILEKDYESVLEKYNLSTVLVFLEYLYCGTLDGLVRKEVKDLRGLAAELNYNELVDILNCLENHMAGGCEPSGEKASGEELSERKEVEDKEVFEEEKDLFVEEDLVDLTQSSRESPSGENSGSASENESNAEKSYWSFLQREKERERLESGGKGSSEQKEETPNGLEEEGETEDREVERRQSNDSATRDLDEALSIRSRRASSDCIVLSSGSESRNPERSGDRMRTPSPGAVDFEVPYFDPYDNMLWFSEEQLSPVNAQSQSLITGDVSGSKTGDALKETPKGSVGREEEGNKNSGYCSTPVTVRRSFKVKSSGKSKLDGSRRRRSDLSGSRILRKSLGLKFRRSSKNSTPLRRKSAKRKEKDLVEVLTDSILNEMSKTATFQSSTPVRAKNFVEITPIPNRDEFGESVTPSPNYSRMEEALLKEHLSKYGLKKNLGKSKARKILRHIYEELHPLYNTKTGKIVKMLPSDTPKVKKKAKPKGKTANIKPQQKKKSDAKDLNSSKESVISDASTLEGPPDDETDGSDMENFSETLTQSVPSNPLDLPSAFVEFLENNPEYHEKILLYEPIWLEELQKKLKESFKKHFKLADLMDYLDQKCITFRSETQVKNAQRKNEKKKKIAGKALQSN